MAATSTDFKRFSVEHRYITAPYTEIALLGCTKTHAFVVTQYKGKSSLQRMSLSTLKANSHDDQASVPHWHDYKLDAVQNFLSGCASGGKACIIAQTGIFFTDEQFSMKALPSEDLNIIYVHSCAMNDGKLFVCYTHETDENPTFSVYDLNASCRLLSTVLQGYSIRSMECIDDGSDRVVLCTTFNQVELRALQCDLESSAMTMSLLRTWQFFKDHRTAVHFTKTMLECQAIVAVSANAMSFSFAGSPSLRYITPHCEHIVDVHYTKFNCYAAHDINNNIALISDEGKRFHEFTSMDAYRLLVPNIATGVTIPKIQHPYKSLSSCIHKNPDTGEDEKILAVLLPSGDLCLIKFS